MPNTSSTFNQKDASAALTNDHFDAVLSRLAALSRPDDEGDDDDRPTNYALTETLKLLTETRPLVECAFPLASVATTVTNGIHLYWRRPDRTLQLSVPGGEGEQTFIYHRDGDDYAAERNVSPRLLARWIQWFIHA